MSGSTDASALELAASGSACYAALPADDRRWVLQHVALLRGHGMVTSKNLAAYLDELSQARRHEVDAREELYVSPTADEPVAP